MKLSDIWSASCHEMPWNIENLQISLKYHFLITREDSCIYYISKWIIEILRSRFHAKTTDYANSEPRILTQRQRLTDTLQHPKARLCQPLRRERLPTRGTPRKQLLRKLLSLRVSPARISNFQVPSHAPACHPPHDTQHQLLFSRLHLVCWRILFARLRSRISFNSASLGTNSFFIFYVKSQLIFFNRPN